jgi:hypothetical protein
VGSAGAAYLSGVVVSAVGEVGRGGRGRGGVARPRLDASTLAQVLCRRTSTRSFRAPPASMACRPTVHKIVEALRYVTTPHLCGLATERARPAGQARAGMSYDGGCTDVRSVWRTMIVAEPRSSVPVSLSRDEYGAAGERVKSLACACDVCGMCMRAWRRRSSHVRCAQWRTAFAPACVFLVLGARATFALMFES